MIDDEKIIIKNEEEAFAYLKRALGKEFEGKNVDIEFRKWPILEIRIEGKGYDSTITSTMAQSLVELQAALNRTYARAIKGTSNSNALTLEERREIQFKAKVEKGSSLVKVDIGEFAAKLANQLANKMDGTDIVVTVVGCAIAAASLLAYKHFLNKRSEDKKVDAETKAKVALSQEETKRLEIFSSALSNNANLKAVKSDFDDVRHDILKSAANADRISIQDLPLTSASAKAIASTPREKAEEVQLNGNYRISNINWSKEDEVRISLYSTDAGVSREFIATMAIHNLTKDNKEKLKECEWSRTPVYLSVNAMILRGDVTTARIVGVDWPKSIAKRKK